MAIFKSKCTTLGKIWIVGIELERSDKVDSHSRCFLIACLFVVGTYLGWHTWHWNTRVHSNSPTNDIYQKGMLIQKVRSVFHCCCNVSIMMLWWWLPSGLYYVPFFSTLSVYAMGYLFRHPANCVTATNPLGTHHGI